VEPTSATRAGTLAAFEHTFESGPASAFFRLWRAHLPRDLISNDSTDSINPRRLEFYLRVHFAVLPFRVPAAALVPTPREVMDGGQQSLQVGTVAGCVCSGLECCCSVVDLQLPLLFGIGGCWYCILTVVVVVVIICGIRVV
jgi:hypothetical protein